MTLTLLIPPSFSIKQQEENMLVLRGPVVATY